MRKMEQQKAETRRLERVLIFLRWLYIPAILLAAWLYGWLSEGLIWAAVISLALANLLALFFNSRINQHRWQQVLGITMLGMDFLAGWALIITGINDGQNLIYMAFAPIIVEAAMRLGLWGALVMDIIFGGIMRLTWVYLTPEHVSDFGLPDYLLTLGVMSFISLMVGMVAREWRKQREFSEKLASEQTLLLERRRISSELHDSILKSLQGLSLEAYSMAQNHMGDAGDTFSEKASYIQEVCQLLSRQIRGVIMELRDEESDREIDTVCQIQEIANAWKSHTGIDVEYNMPHTLTGLSPKLVNHLHNIVTEALFNIERHSRASLVSILLKLESGSLVLSIKDDGEGFDLDPQGLNAYLSRGKIGLVSMKERAELAGGSFDIKSSSNGTILYFNIPLGDKMS